MEISELKVKGRSLLDRGPHPSPNQGVCLMEAVAWFAGERHSDRPKCANPILAQIAIYINDLLEDLERQELTDLIPRLAASAELDETVIKSRVLELLTSRVIYVNDSFNVLERKEAYEILADTREAQDTHRFIGEMAELLYLLGPKDPELADHLRSLLESLLPQISSSQLVAV